MGKTILFTPVGGTDPISASNCYEGAVLHICRYYKPDKVILYMSREMLENQEKDNRYLYCLERLEKLQSRTIEYEIVERRELSNVHEFDYFYEDFRAIIQNIYASMKEGDSLLLNISSGTPAMKSGLLVLQTIGEFPATLIQVATPEKGMNEHIHKGYDVETLWDLNQDNLPDAKNRCKEITCPSLKKIKQEEIIKKHIEAYDYNAALSVTETMKQEDVRKYRSIIELASRRVLLDFAGVDKIARQTGFDCIPVKASSDRKLFEYALNMDVRLKRGEYVDFIRAITPLLVDLFELVLKKQCSVDINDYCEVKKYKKVSRRQWSESKLQKTEVKQVLDKAFQGKFNGTDIYAVHLKYLIDHFSDNSTLKELVEKLRSVEEQIRNDAAHDVISVTEETIIQKTGFTSTKIMQMIQNLFYYTGISVKKEYWKSYDEMNRRILKEIDA